VREALPLDPDWPRYSRRAFPSYRYVPGRSPHPRRDPRGHGFGAAETPPERFAPDDWRSCETFLYGIDLYNFAFFWECHEQLEGLLAEAGRESQSGRLLRGLIQAAASHLKWLTEARAPSVRLARKALGCLRDRSGLQLGVDVAALSAALQARIDDPDTPPAPIRLHL
jgi:hypothetical protein